MTPGSAPWKTAVLCASGFALMTGIVALWSPQLMRDAWLGHNDFVPAYVSGRLASSGDLYSAEANLRTQEQLLGIRSEGIRSMRPPFVAALAKPVSSLPYRSAYLVFQLINVFCMAGFLWIFATRSVEVAVLASISFPMLMALLEGQDIGIVLFLFGVYYLLSEKGCPFAAGVVLSLCLAKFHLFSLLAVMLVMRREWGVIRGAITGAAALLCLSFAVVGTEWPASYWATLRNPAFNPGVKVMPNLHGLSALWGWNGAWRAAAMCAVVVLFLLALTRYPRRGEAVSLALTGGLLLSYHAYAHDALLLLAAFAVLEPDTSTPAMRNLLRASLTPIPYALLPTQNRWSSALVLLVVGAFGAGVWHVARRSR